MNLLDKTTILDDKVLEDDYKTTHIIFNELKKI